jgi:hypothetical protein
MGAADALPDGQNAALQVGQKVVQLVGELFADKRRLTAPA